MAGVDELTETVCKICSAGDCHLQTPEVPCPALYMANSIGEFRTLVSGVVFAELQRLRVNRESLIHCIRVKEEWREQIRSEAINRVCSEAEGLEFFRFNATMTAYQITLLVSDGQSPSAWKNLTELTDEEMLEIACLPEFDRIEELLFFAKLKHEQSLQEIHEIDKEIEDHKRNLSEVNEEISRIELTMERLLLRMRMAVSRQNDIGRRGG